MRTSPKRSRRAEALAALAGASMVVIAIVALQPGSASPASPPSREHPRARRAPWGFPRSGSGAVQAASTYLLALGQSAVSRPGEARRTINAVAAGPFAVALKRSLPAVATALHARLRDGVPRGAFEGWPLAFRLDTFNGSRAVVSVWHLDTAASSTLDLMTSSYATTTYELRWIRGTWRIERAASTPGPTPPTAGASATEANHFARAVATFARYAYVP